MDSRAATPVVEKLLATGLVLLFVGGATATLLGGIVPEYREATGGEVAERVLAGAADRLESAVATAPGRARRVVRLGGPSTIGGAGYRLELADGRLHLAHPEPALARTAAVSLPPWVDGVESVAASGSGPAVLVTGAPGNRTVRLVEGGV